MAARFSPAEEVAPVTFISLYGLMDDLADDSVHRRLSDLGPIFTDPSYNDRIVLGGDLNISPAFDESWGRRSRNVLDRLEAMGLRPSLGEATPTKDVGYLQVDYLYASEGMKVVGCKTIHRDDFSDFSDHAPIIARFSG